MSNEEIVKEIDEATKLLKEGIRKIRDSLNIARDIANKENAVDEEAYNKGLEDGRNEVWEWLKKFGKMRANEAKRLYGYNGELWEIFDNFTPQEVLLKLEEYEKEQNEIKVGDVIEYDGIQAIVMDIDAVDNVALFTENACIESWLPQCTCKKTGKHIDVSSILQQIKE